MVEWATLHLANTLPGTAVLPFVISTGANPDFLLRAASEDHVCGSPWREPHADHRSHGSTQEIRGSAVERSLCGCSFLEMFFLQSVSRFPKDIYTRLTAFLAQAAI